MGCQKLLGVVRDGRLHLRFARGYEYLVGFPVTCACPGCHALNEIRSGKEVCSLRSSTSKG